MRIRVSQDLLLAVTLILIQNVICQTTVEPDAAGSTTQSSGTCSEWKENNANNIPDLYKYFLAPGTSPRQSADEFCAEQDSSSVGATASSDQIAANIMMASAVTDIYWTQNASAVATTAEASYMFIIDKPGAGCYIYTGNIGDGPNTFLTTGTTECSDFRYGYICAIYNSSATTTTEDPNQDGTTPNPNAACDSWVENEYNQIPDSYKCFYYPGGSPRQSADDFCASQDSTSVGATASTDTEAEYIMYTSVYHLYWTTDASAVATAAEASYMFIIDKPGGGCYVYTGNLGNVPDSFSKIGTTAECSNELYGYICVITSVASTTSSVASTTPSASTSNVTITGSCYPTWLSDDTVTKSQIACNGVRSMDEYAYSLSHSQKVADCDSLVLNGNVISSALAFVDGVDNAILFIQTLIDAGLPSYSGRLEYGKSDYSGQRNFLFMFGDSQNSSKCYFYKSNIDNIEGANDFNEQVGYGWISPHGHLYVGFCQTYGYERPLCSSDGSLGPTSDVNMTGSCYPTWFTDDTVTNSQITCNGVRNSAFVESNFTYSMLVADCNSLSLNGDLVTSSLALVDGVDNAILFLQTLIAEGLPSYTGMFEYGTSNFDDYLNFIFLFGDSQNSSRCYFYESRIDNLWEAPDFNEQDEYGWLSPHGFFRAGGCTYLPSALPLCSSDGSLGMTTAAATTSPDCEPANWIMDDAVTKEYVTCYGPASLSYDLTTMASVEAIFALCDDASFEGRQGIPGPYSVNGTSEAVMAIQSFARSLPYYDSSDDSADSFNYEFIMKDSVNATKCYKIINSYPQLESEPTWQPGDPYGYVVGFAYFYTMDCPPTFLLSSHVRPICTFAGFDALKNEVFNSLNLTANASTSEVLSAMDGVLDTNGTLDGDLLTGFGSALAAHTEGVEDANEMLSVMGTAGDILDKADPADVEKVSQSIFGILRNAVNTATGDPVNGTVNATGSSNIVSSVKDLADKIAGSVSNVLSDGDPPVKLSSDNMEMSVAKKNMSGPEPLTMSTSYGSIAVAANQTTAGAQPLQALVFSENIYTFAGNADETATDTLPIQFQVVGDPTASIDYTAESAVNKSIARDSFDMSNVTAEEGVLTQYLIEDPYSFMKISLVIPRDSLAYIVRCHFKEEPNDENKTIEIYIDQSFNITLDLFNTSIGFNDTTGELYIFISAFYVNDTGLFYVRMTEDIAVNNGGTTGRRRRATSSSSYSSSAAVYAPRVWNETTGTWEPDTGVAIDPGSTNEQVVFKSNYMGSITSGLISAPNTIDFDNVFDDLASKVADNPAVLIVVVILAGFYLIFLIPIRMLDVRDYKQWEFLPILHNKPEDKFIYQISISLGAKSSASFDIPVFCVIYGTKGKTTPKTLDDGQRQLFRPNSSTNLIVTCSEDIGDITHFHIWAVTRDERDSLYIEWISVTDNSITTTYTFLCNDWLSPVNTLCYGHEIYMVDMAEGQDFKSLFKNNAKSKLFDDHLWLSVVKRPQKSNFSRVQRLSLCLSTLFLTMVVNAMWFPTDPNVVDESPSIQIGPLSLSFKTFSISIMGALIVIPPNMFIMIFFRRSRPFIPPSRRRRVHHAKSIYEPLKIQDLDVTGDAMKEEKTNLMKSSAEDNSTTNSEAKMMPPPHEAIEATDSHNLERQKTITEKLAEAKNIKVQDQKSMPKYWTGNREPVTKWEMEQELKRLKKTNNKSFTLPWFFIIFGYILVGVCIFNGAFWCFLYSIQWGKEIAHRWLASLFLSLFMSILVIQPVKVILMAVLFSFFLEDSKSSPDDPSTLSTVSQHYGVKTPKETKEPPIIPQKITSEDPEVTYSEQKLHKKLMKKIKATIIHLLYLVLLALIVSHNSDTNFFRQNTAVKNTFGLADISLSRLEEIYPMLREEIFPLIYPRFYYNGKPMDAYNLQFVANMDGYLMGPVRIKQNRDEDILCNATLRVVYSARSQIYECKPVEESRNWNSRWNGTFVQGNFEDPAYHYDKLKGMKKQGDVGSYEQSGYAVDMQKYNYELIMDHLEEGVWIDKQSRAVSVEFVINNMNVNIWTQVKILFELPVYGGVFTTAQVNSFRPYPYNDVWDFVFLCIQCIWALVVFYLVITETISLVKIGCSKYLGDAWHVIEVLNACLCLISMGLFVFRALEVIEAVEFMKNNPTSYTDFDPVMRLDEGYSLLLAFILFIAILQLFRPMDFSKDLTMIKVALSSTSHIIIVYTTIFTVLLLCYGHTLTIAFGDEFAVFNNFFISFYYLFGMLLGVVKYSDVIEKDTGVLRVMFAFYMVMGNFVILNLFISVLCEGLAVVKENPEEQNFDADTSAYIEKKLMGWWNMLVGAEKSEPQFVKVRRGGPWNRELELYYSLLEEDQVTPIEETQAAGYQKSLEGKSDKTVENMSLIEDKMSNAERKSIPVCSTHKRDEHTARLAIKTIIMDMILSNARMRNFMSPKANPKPPKMETPPPSPTPPTPPPAPSTPAPEPEPEREQDEYHCLNETSGKIGPEGGKIEVLPGTWIVIDKKTFTVPSKVRVQAYTTELFGSYVIDLESSEPLHKAFKVSLPFKDGKRRDYCNVFVQRDGSPWTLSYNSVTCFSESLRCMCHVKKDERRFRIAAKSTARKQGVTQAGLKLESDLVTAPVVKQLYNEDKEAMTKAIVQSVADKWMEDAEINQKAATESGGSPDISSGNKVNVADSVISRRTTFESDHDERRKSFRDDGYPEDLDLV